MDNNTKLGTVFQFLQQHREWNLAFQEEEFRRYFSHCTSARARVQSLLFNIVNTQSMPKLDRLAVFWQQFETFPHSANGPADTYALEQLVGFFENTGASSVASPAPEARGGLWSRLFHSLRASPGWGPKTAALFVKCTIAIHRNHDPSWHFLSDAGRHPVDGDEIFVPVDAVIEHLFMKNFDMTPGAGKGKKQSSDSFSVINRYLADKGYSGEQLLIWDELWYWGYLTQSTKKGERRPGWNGAKFWNSPSYPKARISEVRERCDAFLALVNT